MLGSVSRMGKLKPVNNYLSSLIFLLYNKFISGNEDYPVILVDGVCHLCDGAVQFILKWERASELRFAPLQSVTGKQLLQKYGYPENFLGGLILIENGRAYDCSSACLRIAGKLKFPWNIFLPTLLVPKSIRDILYNIVASLRYRLFGKKETCSLPVAKDSMDRFL